MFFSQGIWWVTLLFAVSLWIPQNLVHEGSHAIMVKIFGGKILKIYPYPNRKLNGNFSMATILFQIRDNLSDLKMGLISMMPFWVTSFFVVMSAFFVYQFEFHPILDSFLIALYITNFIDGAFNLSTFYRKPGVKPYTDGWRYAKYFSIKLSHTRILAISWQLIFGFLLLLPL